MVASPVEGGRHGGHVRSGRWFGRRQGVGDGVCPHAGLAAWATQRDADVQDDDRVVAGDAGLAGRIRSDDRGDGVDVDVLEAAVLLPRRGDGGVAAQRGAHEGGARPQERCPGRGVDRAAAGARVVGAVVRAAAGDPSAADADPVSGAADGGPGPRNRPVGADVGRRQHQTLLGRVESEDGVGQGDTDRDDQRRIGPVAARRDGEGSGCGARSPIWPRR